MKAFTFEKYGSSDVLELREMEKPVPKNNEVLVKVHAVSINDWDWQILQGVLFVNRLQYGILKPREKKILGCDVAGRIEAIGQNIKRLKPGDEVFGDLCQSGFGGFAEYVCARETALTLKPAGMTFIQAAAIPQAAMLTLQGLRCNGGIKPGQKLLINGAGGGVGTFGIQLAKLYGVDDVTGVDNAGKLEFLLSMGFKHVIDYTKEDFTKNGIQYDYILDTKTNRSVLNYWRALRPGGIYSTVGGTTPQLLKILLIGLLMSTVGSRKMRLIILKPNKDLAHINGLFETGRLKPVIDGPYAFSELPKAMQYFGEGKHKGKVVINLE